MIRTVFADNKPDSTNKSLSLSYAQESRVPILPGRIELHLYSASHTLEMPHDILANP